VAFEAIWERDLTREAMAWSGAQIFGYDAGEVVGHVSWWKERVHPDDRDRVIETAERAISSGAADWSNEYRFRRKDGSWAWVASRCAIERDGEGRPIRAMGALMDISRLKESAAQLRLFTGQIPVRAGAVDRELRFLWDLGAGFPGAGPFAGKTLGEIMPASPDRDRVVEASRRALAGERRRLEIDFAGRTAELQLEPFRDSSGNIIGVVGLALDVTERARVEKALEEAQRLLLEAQRIGRVRGWKEDVRTGMVTLDLATPLGPAAVRQEAVPREETWKQIHPDDFPRLMELRRLTLEMGGPFETEYRVLEPGGGERVIFIRGELVRDADGKPEQLLGTALDITDRKRAEEKLRKSERLLREAEALGHTGSWEWDLATGEILASDENRRIFFGEDRTKGFKVEDYVGMYHPDDRERVTREMKQIVRGSPLGEIEFRIVWPDGSIRWILGRVLITRSEEGKPLRAYGTNTDMTERKRADEQLKRRAGQQAAIAQLSLRALRGEGLQPIFDEAVALVESTLGVDYGLVLEWMPEKEVMEYRAGAGPWNKDVLRQVTVPTAPGFMAWFYMRSKTPVVVEDLPGETRFAPCELLTKHGIRSSIAVPIAGKERRFGVLEAATRRLRTFSEDEVNFVWAMANVLATDIEQRRAAGELGEKREQLQALSRKLIEAQEAERRAIARELHDDLGQVLTAIKLNVMRGQRDPAETMALVDGAIARMRDLAQDLRPPLLDELGLEASLRWYVEREAGRAGLQVRLALAAIGGRPPPTLETTCFRIAQEALTNVIRHAHAQRVEIELRAGDGSLHLQIRDDGKGFDVSAARKRAARGGSQGLLGMQERVALAGGELEIDSSSGRGTAVRAHFPLPPGV
jgi:PAS domain S-box-containing protein